MKQSIWQARNLTEHRYIHHIVVDRPREVIGEDSNGDGKIDQRDIKRAFVLAPYEWQFGANDESGDLAVRLETLPPYSGNVVFKSNPNKGDTNIIIEDWLGFDAFDMIVASTHVSRFCGRVWFAI